MWREYGWYKRSKPREARGGIKAQTRQGSFGQSWWAKRWIQVLEGFDIGARLSRGRSYARKGQVLSISVEKGKVTAKVQGSRSTPYSIKIGVKCLSSQEWNAVVEALGTQALFVAKLLAGEMPQDIETVFTQAKLSLFPTTHKDLETDCSCPDWSNPCKHIAAVYYLLGEEFDRDPFLLFRLRGLSREELLGRLEKLAPADSPSSEPESVQEEAQPLPSEFAEFWGESSLPSDIFGDVRVEAGSAALPKRLGTLPFWRGERPFLSEMELLYQEAARKAYSWFLGESSSNEEPA